MCYFDSIRKTRGSVNELRTGANEEKGMVSQNTTVIFGGAFYLG
jgi:hypothetical protein